MENFTFKIVVRSAVESFMTHTVIDNVIFHVCAFHVRDELMKIATVGLDTLRFYHTDLNKKECKYETKDSVNIRARHMPYTLKRYVLSIQHTDTLPKYG